jgi:hypothetical protein
MRSAAGACVARWSRSAGSTLIRPLILQTALTTEQLRDDGFIRLAARAVGPNLSVPRPERPTDLSRANPRARADRAPRIRAAEPLLERGPVNNQACIVVAGIAAAGVTAVIWVDADPRPAAAVMFGVLALTSIAGAVAVVPWRRRPVPRAAQQAVLAELPAKQVARGKRLHAALRPPAYASRTDWPRSWPALT